MRAKRLQALLCKGWIQGSGSGSAKAGTHGGMDYLCGRCVYYDEVTSDFASTDGERMEYLKRITMEQSVQNTRTEKKAGRGGLESFQTVVFDTVHYESHIMSTNCGPLGLKADVEPSDGRAALTDRTWAHVCHGVVGDESTEVDFDKLATDPNTKVQINKLRVVSCLVAYVLIFIKHMPHWQPDLAFANLLTKRWDAILWNEFNIPKPSKRKKIKRRMLFQLYAVESAVVEKFLFQESASTFADMKVNPDGTLPPFAVEQLVDVVTSLQRHLDFEKILLGWSQNLDHQTATCSHVFQVKTVLAQLHGHELDFRTIDEPEDTAGESSAAAGDEHRESEATEAEHQRRELAQLDDDYEEQDLPQFAPDAPQRDPLDNPGVHDGSPLISPRAENGESAVSTIVFKPLMQNGMTRASCYEMAMRLEHQRQIRTEYSSRLSSSAVREQRARQSNAKHHSHANILETITSILTDGKNSNGEQRFKNSINGAVLDARIAAGAVIPTLEDCLGAAVHTQFLSDVLEGKASGHFGNQHHALGIAPAGWDYLKIAQDMNTQRSTSGPASHDFNWAILNFFKKCMDATSASQSGGRNSRTVWTTSAKALKAGAKNQKGVFNILGLRSTTDSVVRDSLFLLGQDVEENRQRLPQTEYSERMKMDRTACMHSQCGEFSDETPPHMVHPQQMLKKTPGQGNGHTQLDDFRLGIKIQRPAGTPLLGQSVAQKRLDHLNVQGVLPSCIVPKSFTIAPPIRVSESYNGILVNMWSLREHARLVVEIATYLSQVPGIRGKDYDQVPRSFKREKLIGEGAPPQPDEPEENFDYLEATEIRQDDFHAPDSRWRAHAAENDGDELEQEDGEEPADAMEVSDGPQPQQDARDPSLSSIEESVGNVNEQCGFEAMPGVAAAAAAKSLSDEAVVRSLPYDWDMLQTFLTFKMAETLHNDVHEYVAQMREQFPDVYESETVCTTLRDLPQLCLRFPGQIDDHTLFPLSQPVSLTKSREFRVEQAMNSKTVKSSLVQAALSCAHGRQVDMNEPLVQDYKADLNGVGGVQSIKGNIFARSTWEEFTLKTMLDRGMLARDEDCDRVLDQGLDMNLRVQNARAASKHPEAHKDLQCSNETPCASFAAQELKARAEWVESGDEPRNMSEIAKDRVFQEGLRDNRISRMRSKAFRKAH